MENIVKYQKTQAGGISASNPLIDFIIPEGGTINLKKSFVNVNMSIDAVDVSTTDANGGFGIYNNVMTFLDGGEVTKHIDPVVLVRNAAMSCQKKGLVESIKRVDVLRTTLKQYDDDESTKTDQSFKGFSCALDENSLSNSNFVELNGMGTRKSKAKSHDVTIPLSDIFGIAKVADAFSTDANGQVRLHMELNIDKLGILQTLKAADPVWTDNTKNRGAMTGPGNGAAVGDGTIISLDTTKVYTYAEQLRSPFWVGMKVLVTFRYSTVSAGGQDILKTRTITKIDHNADGTLKLTFNASLQARGAATEVMTAAVVTGVDQDASSSFSVNGAELVVVYNEKPPLNKIQYISYTTEEDNGGGAGSYNKQYQLEPSCVGLVLALPSTNSSLSSNAYDSYRFMVNNEHQTDRKVEKSSSLEYDRRARWYQNHAQPMGSLKEKSEEIDVKLNDNAMNAKYQHNNNAIMEVMPLTDTPKTLGIELVSGANIGEIILFKEVVKSL